MIYLPNPTIDQQLLTHSRELVRAALALLRDSDHLVSAMRLRDELGSPPRDPTRPSRRLAVAIHGRGDH
jgi:hypothetical protein